MRETNWSKLAELVDPENKEDAVCELAAALGISCCKHCHWCMRDIAQAIIDETKAAFGRGLKAAEERLAGTAKPASAPRYTDGERVKIGDHLRGGIVQCITMHNGGRNEIMFTSGHVLTLDPGERICRPEP